MLKRNVRGFTLVEVLISLVVLGLGIVVVLNLFPLGWQALMYSRRLSEVSFLAQKKLEELKSQGAVTPAELSGSDGYLNWSLHIKPLALEEGIEVNFVELDIDFDFQAKKQTQKFVTYLIK